MYFSEGFHTFVSEFLLNLTKLIRPKFAPLRSKSNSFIAYFVRSPYLPLDQQADDEQPPNNVT